jgi:hypothetical protein
MSTKTIVLANEGMYPLSPQDMTLQYELKTTHYHELDSYLTEMACFAKAQDSFYVKKEDLYKHLNGGSPHDFFSANNCESRNKQLEDFGLIFTTDELIFLTHKLIVEIVCSSDKIKLKHIMFDEVPRKTTLERINADRFFDIKAMVIEGKQTNSMGPFNPEKFPHAGELSHFVTKTDEGLFITTRLLTELFKNYPSLDCVSISLEIEEIKD